MVEIEVWGVIAGALGAILALVIYFAPTLIAERRGHPNDTPIFIINIFLGWTIIVWIIILAWSFSHIEHRS